MASDLERRYNRLLAWGTSVGCVAGTLVLISVYAAAKVMLRVDTIEITLMYLALFSVFAAITLLERAERVRLKLAYERAETDIRPPILFLRSFTSSELTIGSTIEHRRGPALFKNSFIDLVARSACHFGTPLALGAPPKGLDTVELQAMLFLALDDEKWFDGFVTAARGARAILLVPDITPGAAREIVTLRDSDLVHKTIVAMPPTRPKHSPWDIAQVFRREHLGRRWEEVRKSWNRHNLRLPAYQESGMLYVPYPDLSPRVAKYFDVMTLTEEHVSALMASLVNELPECGVSMGVLLISLRPFQHER